jgi:exodeoxyribonuclease-5
MIELTPEQVKAHDYICDWVLTNKSKLLTLGGYAGTGKSTIIGRVASTLKKSNLRIAFCAISGKASTVIKSKLSGILTEQDYCGTIHSLIYRLVGKEKLQSGRHELYFGLNTNPTAMRTMYDVIILDEASMVNEYIFRDLSSLGIPILAVGDHGQLPPVKGNFNLMENPQIKLENIMRQAEGNPIIMMAQMAREQGNIPYGQYGNNCFKTKELSALYEHHYANPNSIALCALNRTRVRMNSHAREILKNNNPIPEFNYPVVGEPLICLYNNHRKMVYNGNIGILKRIEIQNLPEQKLFDVTIDMGDFEFENCIEPKQFGSEYTTVEEKSDDVDYFDWGYVITTHKAQGSEWQNVLIIEEGEWMFKGDMWNRWLYTAATRAKESLIIYKR